jgi:pimeloyl-ACP methyl ester carboxylesterase
MPRTTLRTHGQPPFTLAVLHGGPGAAGEVAPVARELATGGRSVLEPLQTRATLAGQVQELAAILGKHASQPLTLVGFSWGAWLAWILAAEQPQLVGQLVLVSCPGFRPEDGPLAQTERLARMDERQRRAYATLAEKLYQVPPGERDALFARLGNLMTQIDAFDPAPETRKNIQYRYQVYRGVWQAADDLRTSGRLLDYAARIRCPVIALHGEHDPHPAEGVRLPLAARLADFRFVLLPRCGHKPWIERQARDVFYAHLAEAVGP